MLLLATRTILSKENLSAFALALLGVVSIAAGVVLAVSSEIGPCATAFWRFAFGGTACACFSFWVLGAEAIPQYVRLLRKPEMWLAGFAFALVVAFWYSGMRISSVATTSTFHNMTPLLLVLAAWMFCGRSPSVQMLAGLGVALAGATVLAMQSGDAAEQTLEGDLLALASAGFLAGYYYLLTKLTRDAHPWAVMTIVSFVSGTVLLLIATAYEGQILPVTMTNWIIVAALGFFSMVLGQALLAWASNRLGAFGIGSVTLLEPGFSAILATIFIAAPLHSQHMIGMCLTFAGLFVILEHRSRVQRQPVTPWQLKGA